MGVYHEVVLDIDPLAGTQLLKLHTVEKTFVDSVGHAAAEGRGEKNIGVRNLERIAEALGINSRDLL